MDVASKLARPDMDISVVICTRNRCATLKKVLGSLEHQSSTGLRWEIVVVDNGSVDQTKEVVEEFTSKVEFPTRYVLEREPGLSNARNHGIRESEGNIVAFLDDDVRVAPDWLAELKTAFDKYECACVGGKILLDESIQLPEWWDERCRGVLSLFDAGDSVIISDRNSWAEIGWGANLSFRRSAFETYGLFRTDLGKTPTTTTLGEETEFVDRLRRNGEKVIHYPRAVVFHCPTLDRFSRQYLRRWYYRVGEVDFLRQLRASGDEPRVLQVPRWKYRVALRNLWQAFYWTLNGNRKQAFWEQLQFLRFSGYFVAARHPARSWPSREEPAEGW
jgi:glycosyltransferase involved in cell wall biosynthesis